MVFLLLLSCVLIIRWVFFRQPKYLKRSRPLSRGMRGGIESDSNAFQSKDADRYFELLSRILELTRIIHNVGVQCVGGRGKAGARRLFVFLWWQGQKAPFPPAARKSLKRGASVSDSG